MHSPTQYFDSNTNIVNFYSFRILLVCFFLISGVSAQENLRSQKNLFNSGGDQLFVFQGDYNLLGTVDEIAQLAALHDYVILTHGFNLNSSSFVNGSCLDVSYSKMPELLVKLRQRNPGVKIFAYVSATADHPNGCWPVPSILMSACPNSDCIDFETWTNLWLDLERTINGIFIDGIFIDLVHPSLIGEAVRDSVFSYVRSKGKLVMANFCSDTIGLKFAAASPFITPDDYLAIEGYYVIAGYPNTQTESMNRILSTMNLHWVALATEPLNAAITCNSDNMMNAYALFKANGGSAFAYQSADVGTLTGRWVYCRNPATSIPRLGRQSVPRDFSLDQNYPNPFNPVTTITYALPKPSEVRLSIYDQVGREVFLLVNERRNAGVYEVKFDAAGLSSGVYFYRIQAGDFTQTKRLLLLK